MKSEVCWFPSKATPNDEDYYEEMPAQLVFEWNLGAVTSFLHKLNAVNREAINCPHFSGPFHMPPIAINCKTFQFELLTHILPNISGVTVHGEHAANRAVAKDYSSFPS